MSLPLEHPRRLATGSSETMMPPVQVRQLVVHHHLQDHKTGTEVHCHNRFCLPAPEASADASDTVLPGS